MLYLVQHGKAASKEENVERPLTERGRREVDRVAAVADRIGMDPDAIIHSGKLRARQTAERLAAVFDRRGRMDEQSFLKAMEDPAAAAQYVAETDGAVVLVGHLPHLSRLAGLLLAGDAQKEVVAFRHGGIVALDRSDGGWHLEWILTPEMAEACA